MVGNGSANTEEDEMDNKIVEKTEGEAILNMSSIMLTEKDYQKVNNTAQWAKSMGQVF